MYISARSTRQGGFDGQGSYWGFDGRGSTSLVFSSVDSSTSQGPTSTSTENTKTTLGFLRDLTQGRRVLKSYAATTFFDWNSGSTLIFWRWHSCAQAFSQDGIQPYFIGPLPNSQACPRQPQKEGLPQLWKKLAKALHRGYLQFVSSSSVKNFVDFFHVPKGNDDIRMVLNGTSCGLNDAIFAPNFWLPYAPTMTRLLHYGYRYVDIDIGECFLNYNIWQPLVNYSALDLTFFKSYIQKEWPSEKYHKQQRIAVVWS